MEENIIKVERFIEDYSMKNIPCMHCKHFQCAYIKNGYMNIECDKRYFELSFEINQPFCCGKFKPNKQYKKYLKLKEKKYEW